MGTPKPTDVINRFYEEMLRDNFDFALEAADPGYRSLTETSEVDPQSLKASCEGIAARFTNLKRKVFCEFNDGNRGVVLHEYTGTDTTTGAEIRLRSADYYELRDGKLLTHWGSLQFED